MKLVIFLVCGVAKGVSPRIPIVAAVMFGFLFAASCLANGGVPSDITGEGVVDYEDLVILSSQWLQLPGIPPADIAPWPDGDATVDFLDFAKLAENWKLGPMVPEIYAARDAADAGIVQGLSEMNDHFDPNSPWDNSWLPYQSPEVPLPDSNATYSFSITGNLGTHQVESVGRSGQAERRVYAALRLLSNYEYALIVEEGIILKNSMLIDGYNSNDPGDTHVDVKIGTKSILPDMIVLNNDSHVDGDVLVGVGGDPVTVIKNLGGTTGDRYALPEELELDVPLPPMGLPPLQPIIYDICDVATITTSGVYVGDLATPRGSTLRIDNPGVLVQIYVTGDLRLGQGAEFLISGTPGVPSTWSWVELYVGGELIAGNSNGIKNETEKPGRFMIYGTGPEDIIWEIKNANDFYGVFNAPNAHIIIKQSGDIYGAFIGKSFDGRQAGNLYYDEDLRNAILYSGRGFGIERWWEDFVAESGWVKIVFDTAVRKSSIKRLLIDWDPDALEGTSSAEVYYYELPGHLGPDVYARFYKNGDDLVVDYGYYDWGTQMRWPTSSSATLASNVMAVNFSVSGPFVEMILTLDNGSGLGVSALRHNGWNH